MRAGFSSLQNLIEYQPTMSGPKCCQNPPAISSGEEDGGEVLQIASLSSYVSGNPDSITAIILVSDIFGFEAPKLRQLADKVAAAGYYVLVPDFLFGDYWTPETQLDDWTKKHAPEQTVEFAKPVVEALKEKGISKIGSAGFCWGAKAVVDLAKEAEIQVAALLHPNFVTLDDIKGVKVPIAILGAEFDEFSPPELIKEFEAALIVNEVYHFVKIYPGVGHGWAIRYNDDNPTEVKSAKEAQQDLVDWFGKAFKDLTLLENCYYSHVNSRGKSMGKCSL
ncbi:putative dienelactone hydrolase, alpha/Beta hydrolase [Helianthus annuus]|uniref:Dienelactone hydrolase, alpha/Beta hydrolase n=2 Tax=Helianthus annuus TaxID=4232 RepID=A0A9K3I0Y4_HELAN|nr:endo-1,3;1,4-beta-D-glucanase [Helianthus annuus]KAF5787771.1 putative dienelactone hydrolase, alpha/Beta hydrolase [Helianthus annuus]